jgi:hypothetical protein
MAADPIGMMLSSMTRAVKGTRAMTAIHADELRPGDVVAYDGHHHQIVHIDRRDGWAWPIATDSTGWAIALGNQLLDVDRAAA